MVQGADGPWEISSHAPKLSMSPAANGINMARAMGKEDRERSDVDDLKEMD